MPASWLLEERRASAAELHASWPAAVAGGTRRVARCRPDGPAVVLGSTQPDGALDGARVRAAGLSVARRGSGGGAVLVAPDGPVWVDLWLPVGDPLWVDDVGRSFGWLGAAWRDALGALGAAGLAVRGPGRTGAAPWARLVCFGGVGAGEVTDASGRKVVGLAQRRTRGGAWFHTACLLRWDPRPLVDVLALPEDVRARATADLAGTAVGLDGLPGVGPTGPGRVLAALRAALP